MREWWRKRLCSSRDEITKFVAIILDLLALQSELISRLPSPVRIYHICTSTTSTLAILSWDQDDAAAFTGRPFGKLFHLQAGRGSMLFFPSLDHVHAQGLDAMVNSDTNDKCIEVKAKALIVFVCMN